MHLNHYRYTHQETGLDLARAVVAAMPNRPEIVHDLHDRHSMAGNGYYDWLNDDIHLAPMGEYAPEDYFRTLFHELIHSTGHWSRLNRPYRAMSYDRCDCEYSQEEVTAEAGAHILCDTVGIKAPDVRRESLEYIGHYLKGLHHAHQSNAAERDAMEAVAYILGKRGHQ